MPEHARASFAGICIKGQAHLDVFRLPRNGNAWFALNQSDHKLSPPSTLPVASLNPPAETRRFSSNHKRSSVELLHLQRCLLIDLTISNGECFWLDEFHLTIYWREYMVSD